MSFAELQVAVAATAPGTRLPLAVWRAGALRWIAIDIGALDSGSPPVQGGEVHGRGDRLGLMVVESARSAETNALRLEVREAHGAALRAGIGAGDVIVALNDVPLDRLVRYQSELSRIGPNATVALLVMRQGRLQYFAVVP